MWKYILAGIVSGILVLGASPVLAEEPGFRGKELTEPVMQAELKASPTTPELRRGLKPLSDEELGEISAAGVGPIAYMLPPYVFNQGLIHPFVNQSQLQRQLVRRN